MKSQTYPKNWDTEPLKNSINLINGRAYALHEWESSGIPVIRLQNLTGSSENYYYSNLNLPEKNYCYSGDLLYMWSATFGPYIWSGEKAIFHYHIWKLSISSRNDKNYIYHLLDNISENLKKTASNGGTMLHITKGFMDELLLPFPPLAEQQKIAQALTDADNYISALEKLIEKKKMIKEGLMVNLLTGKQRLKEFAFYEDGTAKGYKDSELGKIPEDWEIFNIGDLLSITTGDKNTQDKVSDGAYPFFVRSQIIETSNTYSFDGEGVLTAGDGVGTGKIFHYINGKCDIHQRVYLMSNFNKKLHGYFFYLYFSRSFYNRIMSMTAKSSVDSVRKEMIADMKIYLPILEEQFEISKLIQNSTAELNNLEQKLSKFKKIKQGMMQKLLTGEIRFA